VIDVGSPSSVTPLNVEVHEDVNRVDDWLATSPERRDWSVTCALVVYRTLALVLLVFSAVISDDVEAWW